MFSEINVNIHILKGTFRLEKKEDSFTHLKSKQNKNRTYFLCLANNYSTGPRLRGHEYNSLLRDYGLSKQQESKFCINTHVAWCTHDWGHTREWLEDRVNSPAARSGSLPHLFFSLSCILERPNQHAEVTVLNKGWHPRGGIRLQNVTLPTTSKTLVFMPVVRLWTGWNSNCVRKLWKKCPRKKLLPQWFVPQGNGQRYQCQINNT